jgi:hypothetical protein
VRVSARGGLQRVAVLHLASIQPVSTGSGCWIFAPPVPFSCTSVSRATQAQREPGYAAGTSGTLLAVPHVSSNLTLSAHHILHMRFHLLTLLALTGATQAQIILPANPPPANNGLSNVGMGLFFDVTAGASDVTITDLRTATGVVAGAAFSFEVLTFVGSGLGGPVGSGPGSSITGWTSLGVANGTQGAGGTTGTSELVDIPDIVVPAGQTVGVALRTTLAGLRYFGTGSAPHQVFSDANLTLTTGDSRSAAFTTGGTFFSSRALVGELHYVLGSGGGIGTSYCGPGVVNSTGNPGEISGAGSLVVANNNLTLQASSLPNNAFGYFLTSQTQGLVPQPGGSLGVLCLGGNIGRYVGPGQIQNSGGTGSFGLLLDLTQTPTPTGFVSVAPGETWNFQVWHRDSVGGAAVSNFTDGLSATFQ